MELDRSADFGVGHFRLSSTVRSEACLPKFSPSGACLANTERQTTDRIEWSKGTREPLDPRNVNPSLLGERQSAATGCQAARSDFKVDV